MSSSAPVLEYAPPPRRLPWRRIGRGVVLMVVYGLIGALLGWTICPPTVYEANGTLTVSPILRDLSQIGTMQATFAQAMQQNVTGMSSPQHLAKVSADLQSQGVALDPGTLAASLRMEVPKGTNLIKVSFRHREPRIAEAVPSAVMNGFPIQPPPSPDDPRRESGTGIQIINDGSSSYPISHRNSFAAGGFVAGLFVCLLVLFYQRGRRAAV